MLRVRDPRVAVPWFEAHLGMRLVCRRDFADFSLYFIGSFPPGAPLPPEDATSEAAWEFACSVSTTLIELTHNHGTESQAGFTYHNGNTEPRGFGHLAFLVRFASHWVLKRHTCEVSASILYFTATYRAAD